MNSIWTEPVTRTHLLQSMCCCRATNRAYDRVDADYDGPAVAVVVAVAAVVVAVVDDGYRYWPSGHLAVTALTTNSSVDHRPPIRCRQLGTNQTIVYVDFRQIASLSHARPPVRCDHFHGMSIGSRQMPSKRTGHGRRDVDRIL